MIEARYIGLLPVLARIPRHRTVTSEVHVMLRFALWQATRFAAVLLMSLAAGAQTLQFLPEIDAHLTLGDHVRAYAQTKNDRDAGAPNQFTIGPSVQLYLKPLVKLRKVAAFDLDDARSRALVLEAGYRYLDTPSEAPTERIEAVLTTHFPVLLGGLVSDRNRADLDRKSGEFTWRYRNRLQLQRTVAIGSRHPIPYVAAEPFYTEQYSKVSTTALYAGFLLSLTKHVQIDTYYEHENNTGKKPNTQDNCLGFALQMYFAVEHRHAP